MSSSEGFGNSSSGAPGNTSSGTSGVFGNTSSKNTEKTSLGFFGNLPSRTAGNTSGSSGLFGNTSGASGNPPSLFGTAGNTSSGLFGNTSGASGNPPSLFGAAGNTSSGLFGSASSNPSSGLFGNTSTGTSENTSSGLFGNASSGTFGSTSRTRKTSSGLFGNTASRGFGGHFSSTGLIWGETTRVNYYLKFEMALAKVQAKLGIIPQQAADEIAKFCAPNGGGIFGNRFGSIPYATLKESTELTGFSVVGVVQHIVKEVNSVKPRAALGEWAHWGASTQDVTDTATVLQLRDTLEIIQFELDNIMANLQELCKRYKTTPLPARSNLQQAVPISFGFKLARILATFQRHQDRLDDLCPRLLVLEFSGAAGTLATLLLTPEDPELGMDCQRLLAEELGLSVPDIAWHTERDSIAEFGSLCAQLTSTCSKFALDVKSMMQTEVGEVSEPYVSQRGSSTTMPHMMNPISCTHITAMASTVRHLSANLFDAMIADHERDSSSREIEGIVLPQISTLTCDILKMTKGLIEGLEVDEDRMKANLAITRGRIVSEAVMMKLGKIIGRQYAHEVIYEVCRKATLENRPLIELLCEHEEVSKEMKREELEKLCDPLRYLGYSAFMVDKVLKRAQP